MELELREGMPAGAIVYQWLDQGGIVRTWLNAECPDMWAGALDRAGIDVGATALPYASKARSAS